MTALLTIVALVAVSTVLGLVWRARQGRSRVARGEAADFAADGARVTLLQLSTEVCAPCRVTHAVLERVAAERDEVAHVDVDITHRPEIASRFRVLSTPTTLVLDETGAIRARISGAPRATAVYEAIDGIRTPDHSADHRADTTARTAPRTPLEGEAA
jgi:thiol-disulfide isomerase/thioredoxin